MRYLNNYCFKPKIMIKDVDKIIYKYVDPHNIDFLLKSNGYSPPDQLRIIYLITLQLSTSIRVDIRT